MNPAGRARQSLQRTFCSHPFRSSGMVSRSSLEEISADLSELDAARSKELLSDFVSELFLAAADQRRRAERRQQAETNAG